MKNVGYAHRVARFDVPRSATDEAASLAAVERNDALTADRLEAIRRMVLYVLEASTRPLYSNEIRRGMDRYCGPIFRRWPVTKYELHPAILRLVGAGLVSRDVIPGVGVGGWRRAYCSLTDAGRAEIARLEASR